MTPAQFEPDGLVRARADEKPDHVRTLDYVRDKTGRIGRFLSTFKNLESFS